MSDERRWQTLLVDVRDGIALLTLDRPERANAWTIQMVLDLDEALRALDADDDVRVVVVTGAGPIFSVGADLGSGSILRPGDEPLEPPDDPLFPSRVRKPVIAALNGHAVGAGINFAMHCDIRILADTAKVGFAFVRRGVIAEMGMHWLLPRLIGTAAATELLLTGRNLRADEALALGLVHRVVPTADVLATARQIAEDIVANVAPLSAAVTKQLIWELADLDWSQALRRETDLFEFCAAHPDAVEGVDSFLAKRAPRWTGRPNAQLDLAPASRSDAVPGGPP